MAGKPWFNNGIIEIQCNPEKEELPKGFERGRLPLKQESKDKLKIYHQSLSKEDKEAINKRRSDTLKNYQNSLSLEEKEIQSKKISQGLNNRSLEEKENWKQNISNNTIGKNKGNIPWNKGLTKETDQRLMLISEHNSIIVKQYMDSLPSEYFKEWRSHMREVARKNNSYRTSRAEENLYIELCNQYGQEDVFRQHRDEDRYPFDCDFYIKSQDLFIELNKHPSHGPHPFNDQNDEDLKLLEHLKNDSKNPKWNQMIIENWTIRDVKKLKTAIKNNLNYITIY